MASSTTRPPADLGRTPLEVAQSAVKLPPGPGTPKPLEGVLLTVARRHRLQRLTRRYGSAFTVNIPMFGQSVYVTDPDLAKQVFLTRPEDLGNSQPNIGRVIGADSIFAQEGAAHRGRRSLLNPPFHGKSVRSYEQVVIDETLREIGGWPTHTELATLPAMYRITLRVILRILFGDNEAEVSDVGRAIPPLVTLASRLALLPMPARTYGRYTPWGRLAHLRATYNAALDAVIARAYADPQFDDRTDVLSVMLRSSFEDGTGLSRNEIRSEVLALIAAGHETTASTLAWTFERVSRHPHVLAALTDEAATADNSLIRATIREVQRTRPVLDTIARHVCAPTVSLGEWVIPRGSSVIVDIHGIQHNSAAFNDPDRFDPQRFLATDPPPSSAWIPFGGGTRRCVGAALANLEMDVVLRTVLRHFTIATNFARDEKPHNRGLALTPKNGGRIVVYPRN